MDIIDTYFPEPSDVQLDRLVSMRARVAAWLAKQDPTLDTRPGSVFGDLMVQPSAAMLASIEQGLENVLSDFALENVAAGTIYNCPFVAQYLRNFVPDDVEANVASGYLRLVFDAEVDIELDKGMTFISPSDEEFAVRVYNTGPIKILPVNNVAEPNTNSFILRQTSITRYFVDIPVYGSAVIAVPKGSTFATSDDVPNLVSVTAIADFYLPPSSVGLVNKAKKATTAFHAISLNTRAGVVRAVSREFPDVEYVSPVLAGDYEMMRGVENIFGINPPTADIYVRSSLYGSVFKEVVRLVYFEADDVYMAAFSPAHVPLKFTQVEYTGNPDSPLTFSSYCRSTSTEFPMLSAAFSDNMEYWIKVPMPRDALTNNPLVPPAFTDDGEGYQYFEVSYMSDPVYEGVKDFIMSDDNRPMGVSINVRLPDPLIFTQLLIGYTRKKGTIFNKSKAVTEIGELFARFSPTESYSDSKVIDSMFYSGATTVTSIQSSANACVAPADYYVLEGSIGEPDDLDDLSVLVDAPFIASSTYFLSPFKDNNPDFEENLRYAYGPRNAAFILDPANIKFSEQ
jgi:hypothetical protein